MIARKQESAPRCWVSTTARIGGSSPQRQTATPICGVAPPAMAQQLKKKLSGQERVARSVSGNPDDVDFLDGIIPVGGKGELGRLVHIVRFVVDPRLPGFTYFTVT
jgi:hypothetical protein